MNIQHLEQHRWDAFRSTPRSKRTFQRPDSYYIRWLQWLKLIIFLISHCSSLVALFIAKSIVLLLSTNIGLDYIQIPVKFYKHCANPNLMNNQNFDRLSSICAALWLIQSIPDFFAIIQDLLKLKTTFGRDRSLIGMFILFESFRATGLALLIMDIFPLLDIPRCIILTCAFHCISYIRNALRNFQLSFDLSKSIRWRFGRICSSLPSAILFISLFSSAYLWCLLERRTEFYFGILLPISFILCSIGYWESWIDTGHDDGIFHELYEVGIVKIYLIIFS